MVGLVSCDYIGYIVCPVLRYLVWLLVAVGRGEAKVDIGGREGRGGGG